MKSNAFGGEETLRDNSGLVCMVLMHKRMLPDWAFRTCATFRARSRP